MSTAARLLRSWVLISLGAWTFVCCECCMMSRRGFCDGLITRPEKSYRLWRVVVCDLETSKDEAKSPLKGCEYKPTMGCDAERKKRRRYLCKMNNLHYTFRGPYNNLLKFMCKYIYIYIYIHIPYTNTPIFRDKY